jgi:hypothetical protein
MAEVDMRVDSITPILNVSDMEQSFAWFEKLGWQKAWDWGSPATFGGVCAGDAQIFLCLNGQGGRGRAAHPMTFGPESDESACGCPSGSTTSTPSTRDASNTAWR